MAFVQNPGTSSSGGVLDGLIGLVSGGAEVWLRSRELDVREAEAKKGTAETLKAATSEYYTAVVQANWLNVVKWTAIGIIGLVVGSRLVKFLSNTMRGA